MSRPHYSRDEVAGKKSIHLIVNIYLFLKERQFNTIFIYIHIYIYIFAAITANPEASAAVENLLKLQGDKIISYDMGPYGEYIK